MTLMIGYEVVSLVNKAGLTYSSAMRFRPGEGQVAAGRIKRSLADDASFQGIRVNCVLRVRPKPIPENTP